MWLLLLAFIPALGDVSLSGVVTSRSGRHSAVLTDGARARAVSVGDKAFSCEVRTIREDAVDLACGGAQRTLRLAKSAQAPAGAAQTETSAPPAEAADFTLTRAELEARLDREMSRLISETTLIPVTSRGQIVGFTLSRVPEGTILETLGLRAGDALVSVNDTPIDSFTTLVGLWPRLQASGSVRAQILRDGKPVDISVNIR